MFGKVEEFIIALVLLIVGFLLLIAGILMYNEHKCMQLGFPDSLVTAALDSYCIDVDEHGHRIVYIRDGSSVRRLEPEL